MQINSKGQKFIVNKLNNLLVLQVIIETNMIYNHIEIAIVFWLC